MPYVLIMPNTLYSTGTWWARMSVGSRTWDIDTLTRKLRHAKRFAQKVEAEAAELLQGRPRTAAWAINAFIDWYTPRGERLQHLQRLRSWFGDTALQSIGQPEIDQAARALYPNLSPATWCLRVYVPMVAILRRNGILTPIKRPSPKRSLPTILTRTQAETLLDRCDDPDYRAFLTLLFFSGARLGEALRLTWERVDLANRRVLLDLGYRRIDVWRPLHTRASDALASLPKRGPRVFPWPINRCPEREMKRLRERTGIYFNHKMARHSFACWLAQEGVAAREIMDACGWASIGSLMAIVPESGDLSAHTIDRL